ncbi:phage tail tape measure protein [Salmonella enterica]
MSDNNLRLQVVLGAVDKLTRPFKNAQAGSKELASAIRQTRDQIKKLSDAGGQLKSFEQLTQSVSRTGAELDQARLRAQMMTREMSSLESPTKKQTQALEAQWRAVSRLEQKQQQETRQMAAARAELYRLGLSAGGGARETARIARETERYNRQLAEQERRLREVGERQRKLNAIKAKAEKTRELRNSLAGNGAGAMAAGVTTGMTLLAPVKAYSESENAANQLAGSMMGPGGKVAPEFEKINRLAVALGDKLPGTTADFQNMMTMLRRQGMSAQVILGGLGESAAYLGVQLQMAPTAAAEFAAKLQDATQTSEKDMMNLMDVIQKGFYAGVDSGNMLQGFSKISSAMDIIHKKGLTGNNKTQGKAQVQVVGGAAAAAVPFAGMYDSGGIIPRGQFGIVGENGPEIVNGPAHVTSRRRTAALASVVAGVMGVAAAPAEAAPLHPYSLPTVAYKQSQPAKSASVRPVMHFETHAPITIYAQPGQSAQDIAREVARQLDERERKTRAKARSNFSDQGGYE